MLNNLCLGYTVQSAIFLLSATVSASPTKRSQGRKRQLQSNSSSLSQSIEDAVDLDKDIKEAQNDADSDSDSDSDDDDDDDEKDNRNKPSASTTASTTVFPTVSPTVSPTASTAANTLPSATTTKFALQTPTHSNTARNIGIAVGVVGGLISLALIGFALFRWRASKKSRNQGPWNDEKHPPIGGRMYQNSESTPPSSTPPSTLFGGHGGNSSDGRPALQRHESIPAMPKPPPLVLNPRGSEKLAEDNQTFFLDQESSRASNLPPVYEEMRSPSQESSISQTVPYPNRNPETRNKAYASFQPPPAQEPPPVDPQSRFSWTTRSVRTSVDSAPRFRTVVSWVNHQTNRPSMKEKLEQMELEEEEPPVPPTPVEFRQHPGAPVGFLAQHGRQESADLDRQFTQGK